jgi:glycosyltransferase involved in cell wall biosynthesis
MIDRHDPEGHGQSGVTLIVVTYRQEGFVDELLASIAAQTTPPQRVILCDDASPDASALRLREWAEASPLDTVLLLAERNRGLPATLNAALAHVRTPFYAYIAGDDVMRPDRIERQLAVLADRPDLAFVYSDAQVIDAEGAQIDASFVGRHRPDGVDDSFEALLVGNWIPAPSVMVRTAAAREVGAYDEDVFLEDYGMWLRLASSYAFTHVDDTLVSWRELPTSLGARKLQDHDLDWALARIRIRAGHWGRNDRTDRLITDLVRPLLLALARQGVSARTLAPHLRQVARVDRRPTSRSYALVSRAGSTTALRLLARAGLASRRAWRH